MKNDKLVTVKYVLDLDTVQEFFKAVLPFAHKVIYEDRHTTAREWEEQREKRLRFILQFVSDKKIISGKLFKVLKKNGYGYTYKTLQRDLTVLKMRGNINMIVESNTEVIGKTSVITKGGFSR